MMRVRTVIIASAAFAVAVVAGCVSPGEVDPQLVARYQRRLVDRGPRQRVSETGLLSLKPSPGSTGPIVKVVDRKDQRGLVDVSLDQTILWTVANNPDIAVVSFDPAISREEVVAAAAAFDVTAFATLTDTDRDRRPAGGPVGAFFGTRAKTAQAQGGFRQTLPTGTQWTVTADVTRSYDDARGRGFRESWEPSLDMQITQPLLRNGWTTFNLATLRVARINQESSLQAFRQTVEQSITEAVGAYWRLYQARRDLTIQQRLVTLTETTLDKVRARKEIDVTTVEESQLESALESRRAGEITARKTLRDAEQALARLVGQEQINVISNYEIVPTTEPVEAEVMLDATDQLVTALRNSPQLAQARLALASADINVQVAKNQTLPVLNFTAGATIQGQDPTFNSSVDRFNTFEYIGYNVGLEFEYPLGNRQRQADLRRARLQRGRAVAAIQQTADSLAVAVVTSIRQIKTSYLELQAQQAALEAARVHLRALEDSEIKVALSPEYLNVKLAAQSGLASAELAVVAAQVNYNIATFDLARLTGTVLQQDNVRVALPQVLDGR